jgi:hypothetical protein
MRTISQVVSRCLLFVSLLVVLPLASRADVVTD